MCTAYALYEQQAAVTKSKKNAQRHQRQEYLDCLNLANGMVDFVS